MQRLQLLLCAAVFVVGIVAFELPPFPDATGCLGEFQRCSGGDCVMSSSDCGKCRSGQFLCPSDQTTCVNNASDYVNCPNIKGTHLDWTIPLEARLDYLAQHTTVAEQIAQLTNDAPELPKLGIPAYNWLNDDEHGVNQEAATSFPNGCALGATWSKQLLYAVGAAVGNEARGLHNGFVHEGDRGHGQNGVGITMYAPNMNLVRDPRWGRAQEVYSEDPRLSSGLTWGFVNGSQGTGGYMQAAACCKHFAAYDIESIPTHRFVFDAQVNARNMWETYMPVFHACVVEAQGAHVMCSYNALNGVPTCGNAPLLNGILRGEWNWPGFVVSDYDAWAQIYDQHHYCSDYTCAAATGLNAGMDQEGGGTSAIDNLALAISKGMTTSEKVATAFKRLFRVRILLGMLDPPTMNPWNFVSNKTAESPEHLALALRAAREAMCLYKNDHKALPIDLSQPKRVALIGPQGPQTVLLLGNYARPPNAGIISIQQGMLNDLGIGDNLTCTRENDVSYHSDGDLAILMSSHEECARQCSWDASCTHYTFLLDVCYLSASNSNKHFSLGAVAGSCDHSSPHSLLYATGCDIIACPTQLLFPEAVAVAKTADVVVVTVGLDQTFEREGHDRETIDLPENQYALVAAIRKAVQVPVVVVFVHGGTFSVKTIANDADAVLDAWYPGEQGGQGVADVLFGLYNPAGRASVTYYRDNSDLPPMGDMDEYPHNGSLGITYRYFTAEPQIPFGFGLSYTTFEYSDLVFNLSSAYACQVIGVNVTVRNTGTVTGDEVAQLYVSQPKATVPAPQVRLADFERVQALAPGEARVVSFAIAPHYHSVVHDSADVYEPLVFVESGPFNVFVGGGQQKYYSGGVSGAITVRNTQDLKSC